MLYEIMEAQVSVGRWLKQQQKYLILRIDDPINNRL